MTEAEPRKHYARRNPRAQGQVYCDHVLAMTREDLHSKSDIAAELAHRDILIADLLAMVHRYAEEQRTGEYQSNLSEIESLIARAEGRQP